MEDELLSYEGVFSATKRPRVVYHRWRDEIEAMLSQFQLSSEMMEGYFCAFSFASASRRMLAMQPAAASCNPSSCEPTRTSRG
jgi:hypothetical protein